MSAALASTAAAMSDSVMGRNGVKAVVDVLTLAALQSATWSAMHGALG
jgi:hypothetical protein